MSLLNFVISSMQLCERTSNKCRGLKRDVFLMPMTVVAKFILKIQYEFFFFDQDQSLKSWEVQKKFVIRVIYLTINHIF